MRISDWSSDVCSSDLLDQILLIPHPFMPFMTEELWATTAGPARKTLLAVAPWPELEGLSDTDADAEMGWVIRLISDIRSVRAEIGRASGRERVCKYV